MVQRWLDAGLVVFGKTNTPEFGAKGITEPDLFGPARNPWNPGAHAGRVVGRRGGGRRGGHRAVRGGQRRRRFDPHPGLGLRIVRAKPSRGLIPAGPSRAEGLGGTATEGVISRSVRDTAAMLDLLAGPTSLSPFLAASPEKPFADEVEREPGRLRVALCTASSINPNPHPEAIAAARAAADLLEELGHEVVELKSQPFDDAALAKDFLTTWFVSCAHSMAECKASSGAGDSAFELDTRTMAALGRATDPVDLLRAIERRHEHTRRLAEFHESYDFLLTPSTATPPPKIGAFDTPAPVRKLQRGLLTAGVAGLLRFTPIVDQLIHENLSWVPYTQLANLTGRPAMSVPLHWTADGLPIGAQFVGRLGADSALLRLAGQLEKARPWVERRPTLS